jgi:predicted transcriptional regulator
MPAERQRPLYQRINELSTLILEASKLDDTASIESFAKQIQQLTNPFSMTVIQLNDVIHELIAQLQSKIDDEAKRQTESTVLYLEEILALKMNPGRMRILRRKGSFPSDREKEKSE